MNDYLYSSQSTLDSDANSEVVPSFGVSPNPFVRLFIAIEKIDISKRACCYAFANLHRKGSTIKPILEAINNAIQPAAATSDKVYEILKTGRRWAAILEAFESLLGNQRAASKSLLYLLPFPSK